MGKRFRSLTCSYLETDLWIAFDVNNSIPDKSILDYTLKKIIELRQLFEDYFILHPDYKTSLKPLQALVEAPKIIKGLADNSLRSGVGPMAGIAGAFAEEIALSLKKEFHFNEIIVENGGDIFLDIKEKVTVSLYAGSHPLSNKVNLLIEPSFSPLGLCASSGQFGHSFSKGKADLVAVASKDAVWADQLATFFANMIKKPSDIQHAMDHSEKFPDILHLSVFANREFAIKGSILIKNV
ncbi:MAG: UPF0280 family protein [Candidatus Neomarinimicrobiota bacterium]